MQLAVEKIFLETSVQLVSEGSSELSDRQAEALEKLTFDWVLNAEKYVDARFSELYKAREKAGSGSQEHFTTSPGCSPSPRQNSV